MLNGWENSGQAERSGVVGQVERSGVAGQAERSGIVGQAERSGVVGQAERSGVVGQAEVKCVVEQAERSVLVGQAEVRCVVGQAERSVLVGQVYCITSVWNQKRFPTHLFCLHHNTGHIPILHHQQRIGRRGLGTLTITKPGARHCIIQNFIITM